MTPQLNCKNCGGNRFRFPPFIRDDTPIVCDDCGQSAGSFSELAKNLSQEILETERERAEKISENGLSGNDASPPRA